MPRQFNFDNKEYLDKLKKIYEEKGAKGLNEYLTKNNITESHSLAEIAYVMGVTRERIRQIEASAFAKLRHPRIGRKLRKLLRDYCEIDNKPEFVSLEQMQEGEI